jgi:hypothetical protein
LGGGALAKALCRFCLWKKKKKKKKKKKRSTETEI